MKHKIYIAGCGGMLGDAFYKQFKDDYILKCTDKDVNESWIKYLDFRDSFEYFNDVQEFGPDYLFHLGAFTDMEYCELNADESFKNNTIAVESAVKIANMLNITVLYISTAGIFSGNKDQFDEWDQPLPMTIYGRSKYAGERYVIENAKRYFICRAGWMMGGGPAKDKKFIQKIMLQIKEGKKELFIVNDKYGTPTYTHDFARNVRLLIEKDIPGLYNMVCEGITDRYDIVKELLNILNLKNEIKLLPVDSSYFSNTYFAERPHSERLINRRLNIQNLNIMRDWKVVLKEYITDYYKNYL